MPFIIFIASQPVFAWSSPVYSITYIGSEEWEARPSDTSEDGIRGDCGCCKHEVGIDEVLHTQIVSLEDEDTGPLVGVVTYVQTLQEDGQDAEADEDTSDGGRSPLYVTLPAGPGKPAKMLMDAWTRLLLNAYQNKPSAKTTPPTMTWGIRHSGIGLLLFPASFRLYEGTHAIM